VAAITNIYFIFSVTSSLSKTKYLQTQTILQVFAALQCITGPISEPDRNYQ